MFEKIISNNTPESKTMSKPASPSSSSSSSGQSGSNRNILSKDVEVTGKIKIKGDLEVDGKVDGEITASGVLIIHENAKLKAKLNGNIVVIQGKVEGNIVAEDRIELLHTAEVFGDIKAAYLKVDPGATFLGNASIGKTTAQSGTAKVPEKKSA